MNGNITSAQDLKIFQKAGAENNEYLFLKKDDGYHLNNEIQKIEENLNISLDDMPEECNLFFKTINEIGEQTFIFNNNNTHKINLFLDVDQLDSNGKKSFSLKKNAFGKSCESFIEKICSTDSNSYVDLFIDKEDYQYIKKISTSSIPFNLINIYLKGKWNKAQITELLGSTENDCKLYKTKSFIYESDEKIDKQYNPKLSKGLLNSIKDTIEEKNEEKNIKERKAKKSENTEPGIDSIEEDDSSNKYFRFDELGDYNTDLKKEIFKELINKFQDNDMKINIKPTTIIFSENKIEYKDTYSVSFNGDLVNALKELCECKFYINSEEKSPENNKSNRDNIKESFREYLQSNQNHLSEINSDLINYYPDGSIKPLDLIKLIKESNIIDENKTNSQNKKNLESLFNEYKFLTRSKDAKIKQWIYKELCTNKGKLRLAGRGLKSDYNEMLKIRSETPADNISICNPLKKLIERAENLMEELKEARKEVN